MTVITSFGTRSRAPVALGAFLVSFAAFWIAQRAAHVSMIDLLVYRAEGATVRAGGDLYALRATAAGLPTTYPPFAALLFTPLTLPETALLRALAALGNLVLLVAFVRLSLSLVGHTRVEGVWWTAAVAVWCEPVWTTLRYGQINLLLAVLVLWDLSRRSPEGEGRGTGDGGRWTDDGGLRRRAGTGNRWAGSGSRWAGADARQVGAGGWWAGVGLGLATAIKLTPALFVVFLALTGAAARLRGGDGGPWLRHARGAVVAFAGATLLAAAVLPYDSWRYWTGMVFRTGRVGHAEDTANQALRGVLARLLHTPDPGALWIALAALAAVAGLWVAVSAELAGLRSWAVASCAVTALLISPVSWSHHWVWCVPLVLLLWTYGRRATALGCLAVFCSYALWWVPHGIGRPELHQGGAELLLSALYAGCGLLFLLIAGQRCRGPATRRRNSPVRP